MPGTGRWLTHQLPRWKGLGTEARLSMPPGAPGQVLSPPSLTLTLGSGCGWDTWLEDEGVQVAVDRLAQRRLLF